MTAASGSEIFARNRRATHDYHIEAEYEVGLVLEGWEVQAIRRGQATLAGAYVRIEGEELFLVGAQVTPLQTAAPAWGGVALDPQRSRKVLLKKGEIARLVGKVQQAGFTLVPLELHRSGRLVKLRLALAKGKAHRDKREDMKTKDWAREQARVLKIARG